jgi:hypothetical protein
VNLTRRIRQGARRKRRLKEANQHLLIGLNVERLILDACAHVREVENDHIEHARCAAGTAATTATAAATAAAVAAKVRVGVKARGIHLIQHRSAARQQSGDVGGSILR